MHLSFLSLLAMLVHPLFISMTEVNYQADQSVLQVNVRIFTDDLYMAIEQDCQCTLSTSATTQQIARYVNRHFSILINGKPKSMLLKRSELEEESTWNYFEIENVSGIKELKIINSLLYSYQKEQVNLVHILVCTKEKTLKLTYPKNAITVKL